MGDFIVFFKKWNLFFSFLNMIFKTCWENNIASNSGLKKCVVGSRLLITNHRFWQWPKTCTTALSSISHGSTCTQCLLSTPVYPHIPSYMHTLSTLGLVMVIQGSLAKCLSLFLAIFYLWQLPMSHGAPLVMILDRKLGDPGVCFVNARFPYLFCVTSLYVLSSVVVHICMRAIHILPFSSSSSS